MLFGELNAGKNSSRNYDGREIIKQLKLYHICVWMYDRVTSCLTLGDKFYVYPGKDEVWAVYSRQTWSPFFVVPFASFPGLHMYGFMYKA